MATDSQARAVELMSQAISSLRGAGLTVITHPGWQTRGWSERAFTPTAVVQHHDASPPGASPGVPTWMASQLDGTGYGAHWWVSTTGVWWAVAAQWCPHTGAVLPYMPDNDDAWGVETDHTTGEFWPQAQLASLRLGSAVLLDTLGRGVDRLHMHKTICKPVGRKVDPDGLSLSSERTAIAPLIRATQEDVMDANQEAKLDRALAALEKVPENVWTYVIARDDPSRAEGQQERTAPANRWLSGTRLMTDGLARDLDTMMVAIGKAPVVQVDVAAIARAVVDGIVANVDLTDLAVGDVASAIVDELVGRLAAGSLVQD